ncbi:unnamed protein product, partial [Scytosiphon promiscuus]
EVCKLGPIRKTMPRMHTVLEIMSLPAAYTKGANALGRSKSKYKRKSLTFTIEEFHRAVQQIETLAKSGAAIDPKTFYPTLRQHKGKSRDLPMVDKDLQAALNHYLRVRLAKDLGAKPTDPLFLSQKRGPYSPNTVQEHMAHMLRNWLGGEKASSHSGRRSLITDVIHK